MSKGRMAVGVLCFLWAHTTGASLAHAHHPTASGLPNSGLRRQQLDRAGGVAQTALWQSVRYRRLVDLEPSYSAPLGDLGDDLISVELGSSLALASRVEMMTLLPLVSRQPRAEESTDRGGTGLGDVLLGTRFFPWLSRRGDASLALGATLAFPTSGVRPREEAVQEAAAGLEQGTQGLLGAGGPKLQPSHGFGNAGGDTAIETDAPRVGGGVFMSRVFGSYFQLLGPLSVQAEFGFSWSFRKDVNPALDYGATIGWAPTSWWGIFTSGEARTFLLSNDSGLASVQSQERQSGDTLVVVSPGVWLAPSAVWSLTVSPQLPVTDARDFTWGLSASTAWRFD